MTEVAGTAYRPSPRPRPADAPRLHVVPPPAESELPTSGNVEKPPTETISAGQSGSSSGGEAVISDIGFRVRLANVWRASRAYWTPPAVFTEQPASLADLAEYARQAPWTAQQTGMIRAFGVGYCRFVAYPYTVVSRYREWFAQRPLRLAALLGGIKLASLTGPGAWVVDHLVYPAVRLVGHVLL